MTSRSTSTDPPTDSHHIGSRERHNYQSFKFKQYADYAQTVLIAATIASTITLSKVFEPDSKNALHEDGVILAWASSIFVTSVAGSIILVASAKLELAFHLLQAQALVVSLLVLVAFYLLLAIPSFRQQYTGAFVFGTVCYWVAVVFFVYLVLDALALYLSGRDHGRDWWAVYWRRKSLNMSVDEDNRLAWE